VNREAWRAEEQQRLVFARSDWQRDYYAEMRAQAEAEVGEAPAGPRFRILRDSSIGVLLAAAAALIYAEVAPIMSAGDSSAQTPAEAMHVPPPEPAPAKVAAVATQTLTITHGANLRQQPSSDADVITTIPRGTTVFLVERQGSWTHVRLGASDGQPARDGWVYSSYVTAASGG
jgi:hypothetical protein